MSARILIIEDNTANLALMTYLLRAYGHTPLVASEGDAGLKLANDEKPDLILCDVQLPNVSGYDIARQIKAAPALRDIPLVAVTAFAMVGDREKALAAGFDGYLTKPIEPETFVQQVEGFLHAPPRTSMPAGDDASGAPRPVRAILVVDNEQANLDFASCLLGAFGYTVVTATDARRALELAREARPDLIMSDVCMAGGLSGYDFIAECKRDPALASVPFVFVTSTMTDEKERRKGLALGAARFLFRPIEPQELIAQVDACLRQEGRA